MPTTCAASIGVIPQAMTSDLELSADENLLIFAKLYGVPRERRKRLIARPARGRGADPVGRQAGEEPLGRHAAARRDRARAGARAEHLLPRRADHRARSRCRASRCGRCSRASRAERDLTVLLTTHYMDEADKLCDRIAIVDHGKLMALDSPMKLKAVDPRREHPRGELLGRRPPDWARHACARCRASRASTAGRRCLPHLVQQRAGDDDGAARGRGARPA